MRSLPFLLLAACSVHDPKPPAESAQMNDLSIMFPLTGASGDYLGPTTPAVGGVLFPEDVYSHDNNAGFIPYSQLHAVGFRLDPCFGHVGPITDPSTCKNQLRVVFQPIAFDADQTFAEDAGVHAFYSITREQLIEAVGDIIAARRDAGGDDDLGPLAPHPLVVQQGMAGDFAKRLEAIVTKYAGQANLVRFTTLTVELPEAGGGTGGGPAMSEGFWTLDGFDVASGVPTPISIASLMQGDTNQSISAGTQPLSAATSPITTSSDNLMVLADEQTAMAATPEARRAAFDAALRIESPAHHTPDTIDCGSCHLAEPARVLVAPEFGLTAAGNPNAFVADPSIPAADLVATTTNLVDGNLNIHAFSYLGTGVMINQRVINETAANLAYIQTLLP